MTKQKQKKSSTFYINVFIWGTGALFILTLVVLDQWGYHPEGRVLRLDKLNTLAYDELSEDEALAQLKSALQKSSHKGFVFKDIELDNGMMTLRFNNSFYRDQKRVQRLISDQFRLDEMAYFASAESVSNSSKGMDRWELILYCADYKPCITKRLGEEEKQVNHTYIVSMKGKPLGQETMGLLGRLLQIGGAKPLQLERSVFYLQRQYKTHRKRQNEEN